MTRRERLERKLERRQGWAEKASIRSDGRFCAAAAVADGIPLGQPILVGHHSERHARRDAERIRSNMSKGCEEAKLSELHTSKAEGLAVQLDRSIFSDDETAIADLEKRAAKADAEADRCVAINKAWKKSGGDMAALVRDGVLTEAEAKFMAASIALCPWLNRKPMDSTHARARARSDRERIKEIERRVARAKAAEVAPGGVLIAEGNGWCSVTFAEKPAREVLDALKAAGFGWGGGAWCGYREKLPACVVEMAK